MPVQDQQPIVTYIANGDTTKFTITFDLHDPEQLVVLVNNQVPEVGTYTVTGNEIEFSIAPTSGSTIELYRDTILNRSTNYKAFDGSFSPNALNWDLDRIWHVLQEQNIVDAKILARIKEEIEWRRTHDFNYDSLAQVRDMQVFGALKQYLDTILAATTPNIFGGVTAGVVFALDHKSVQTHLEEIAQRFEDSRMYLTQQLATKADKSEFINLSNTVAIKADKTYVDELVTNTSNNIHNYKNEAELLAFTPAEVGYTAKALDTKKVWYWGGTSWEDTGLSELDLAKEYADDIVSPSVLPEGADLNNVNDVGIYSVLRSSADSYINLPLNFLQIYGQNYGGTLVVIGGTETPVRQQVFYTAGDREVYTRSSTNLGVWSNWYLMGNKTLRYENKNLDQLMSNGLYVCVSNNYVNDNYPIADQLLLCVYTYSNITRQVAYQRNSNAIWVRSYWGTNGWQNWTKLLTEVDLNDFNAKLNYLSETKADKTVNTIGDLYNDLHNPLLSLNIKLIGDSITWGSGASNTSPTEPRNGTLSDVRNTTDPVSPSWANLLRWWLCSTYTDGELVHEGDGSAYAVSLNNVLLSKDVNLFKLRKSTNNVVYSTDEVLSFIVDNTTSVSGEYIDLYSTVSTVNRPNEIEFMVSGNGFTLVFAKFDYAPDNEYNFGVYIDGVLLRKVGLNNSTASFNFEEFIELPDDGKHQVVIKNESVVNYPLRLQQIKVNKYVRVINDGINGSSSRSWLNSVKLSDSIKRKDDYVFVQLGTNDRIIHTNNSLKSFSRNLGKIVDDIHTLSLGNAKVILMSANDVTQDQGSSSSYFMTMKTVNNIVKQVADNKRVSFISNFEVTEQLKLDGVGFLRDQLHPNDVGYRVIFENIRDRIINRK